MSNLVNKIVRITNTENENYIDWLDRDLVISSAVRSGVAYDASMYPHYLCDVDCVESGETCPFSLYEWEFEEV